MTKTSKPRRRATGPAHRIDPNALVPHATVLALEPEVLHSQAERSVRALLQEGVRGREVVPVLEKKLAHPTG